MALQTFTPGQVLTAAQVTALQTNDFNQTVSTKTASYTLVALDKGTRVVMNSASATTITVNTSLFNAGDTLQIHNIGAGVCTITAGTATVSTAGSLALATNAGGTLYFTSAGVAIFFPSAASSASGLTLINSLSFSGVSSQSFNDVFSATYDSYIIKGSYVGSADNTCDFRLRVGGSDNSAANYERQIMNVNNATTSFARLTGQTTWVNAFGHTTNYNGANIFEIQRPFNAFPTTAISLGISDGSTDVRAVNSYFKHTASTSFTGFSLLVGSGTITGSVSVYGYNK